MDSDDLKLMCWTLAFACLYANRDVALAFLSRPAPVTFVKTQATASNEVTDEKQSALTSVTTLSNGGTDHVNQNQSASTGGDAPDAQANESYLVVLSRMMISEFETFEGYVPMPCNSIPVCPILYNLFSV